MLFYTSFRLYFHSVIFLTRSLSVRLEKISLMLTENPHFPPTFTLNWKLCEGFVRDLNFCWIIDGKGIILKGRWLVMLQCTIYIYHMCMCSITLRKCLEGEKSLRSHAIEVSVKHELRRKWIDTQCHFYSSLPFHKC